LTEQKKTGDCVVLFVASSTASQFYFTQAYDFEFLTAKTEIHQFPAQGEINYFQKSFFLGKINMWINEDGVRKLLRKVIKSVQLKYKGVKD